MGKRKLLFLVILILVTCTGCSVEYNLTITKNNIEEIINVRDYINENRTEQEILKHYNTWYPTFVNFINEGETIEIENFDEKISGVKYHEKEIFKTTNGYNYTYKYTYSVNEYYDSYVLANVFPNVTAEKDKNNIILRTSKENFLCNYDYFDSVKVNITIDPEVYELNYTNTSEINNNTYTWYLDRSDCTNSQIILTLNRKKNINDSSTNTSNNSNITNNYLPSDQNNIGNITNNDYSEYTMYIFAAIAIVIILIGSYIFKKLKEKSDQNNTIDD